MKKNFVCGLSRKLAAGTLALALTLTGVCVWSGEAAEAQASEVTEQDTWVHTEQLDISSYRTEEGNYTAPKPTDSTHKDWLFAGWYMEENCTTAVGADVVEGECYAKFVPAEVLSVKCQIQAGITDETTENGKLRIVSTVDTLNYQNVGFEIRIEGGGSLHYETKEVYQRIAAESDGVAFDYAPEDFHESAQYFVTATIINIPNTAFKTGIQITPYWTTLDGTKVSGVSRYARVEDGYLNIVNVPVRLYSVEEAAAGYLEVAYDGDKFAYVGADTGNVFAEMETADDGSGRVRCVGNVADISGNAAADGMYVNLRFQVKEDVSLGAEETFTVSGEDFCDNQENLLEGYDVSDVVYKNLSYTDSTEGE